jgi:hypothetical protein
VTAGLGRVAQDVTVALVVSEDGDPKLDMPHQL